MKAKGVSNKHVARYCGVTEGAVSNWFSSGRISKDNLVQVATLLGVPVEELITGEPATATVALTAPSAYVSASGGPSLVEIPLENNPEYPAIRKVKFKLSAGASGFAVDYDDSDHSPMVFHKDWYKVRGYTPHKLFAVKVLNGSMEPGLSSGDTVVVNTESTDPKDGVVFAVNYEGELVIKRLVRDEGAWWLSSDNPNKSAYPRKRMTDDCFIIGKIVHKQSEWV